MVPFRPPLVLRWEDALQRDDKVQHQVRHHVVMGLTTTDITHGVRGQRSETGSGSILIALRSGQYIWHTAGRNSRLVGLGSRPLRKVQVLWHRLLVNGYRCGPCRFSECVAITHVNRHLATQVGECKSGLSVPAVGSAKQCEQRLILVYWQELPVAKSPALGGEVKRHDLDFAKERFRHVSS